MFLLLSKDLLCVCVWDNIIQLNCRSKCPSIPVSSAHTFNKHRNVVIGLQVTLIMTAAYMNSFIVSS